METDDEIKGHKNSYDFGARLYDPRVGRWLSIDPLAGKQSSQSPYKAFYNSPIIFSDPDGREEYLTIIIDNQQTGEKMTIEVVKAVSKSIMTDGKGSNDVHSNNYWDYETTITITIDTEGKRSIETTGTKILYENGMKDFDMSFGSYNTKGKGYTKSESDGFYWGLTMDMEGKGGKQRGGWSLETEGEDGDSPKQKGGDSENINIDGLGGIGGLKGGNLDIVDNILELVDKLKDYDVKVKVITWEADGEGGKTSFSTIEDIMKSELEAHYSDADFSHETDDGIPFYIVDRAKDNKTENEPPKDAKVLRNQ